MTIEQRPITDRGQWLEWRGQDVTASVIGALFGVHPYTTAFRLYVEKRGVEFPGQDDNKVMRRGRWMEPAIATAVEELRPDWVLKLPKVYLRDPELRLGATPDFFIHGDSRGRGVLQAKSVAPMVWHDDWLDGTEAPQWIVLQCATEMLLADAAFGVIAVMLVDPFAMDIKLIDVPRDDARELLITTAVRSFWDLVARGEEPAPDYGRDTAAIKALYPHEATGKSIDLSSNNYLPELLADRVALKSTIERATSRCNEIENELKYLMKDAEVATGIDGWSITYKSQNVKGYEVKPRMQRPLIVKRRSSQNRETES